MVLMLGSFYELSDGKGWTIVIELKNYMESNQGNQLEDTYLLCNETVISKY